MNKLLLKKILQYLLFFVLCFLLFYIFSPKINFLSNKSIRTLKNKNEELEKINSKLVEKNKYLFENEKKLNYLVDEIKDSLIIKQKELDNSIKYNLIIKTKLDSLEFKITQIDSSLVETEKKIYETINDTNNLSINEHYKFFTKWLNERKRLYQ